MGRDFKSGPMAARGALASLGAHHAQVASRRRNGPPEKTREWSTLRSVPIAKPPAPPPPPAAIQVEHKLSSSSPEKVRQLDVENSDGDLSGLLHSPIDSEFLDSPIAAVAGKKKSMNAWVRTCPTLAAVRSCHVHSVDVGCHAISSAVLIYIAHAPSSSTLAGGGGEGKTRDGESSDGDRAG